MSFWLYLINKLNFYDICNESELFFTFAKESQFLRRSRKEIQIFTCTKESKVFLNSVMKLKFLETLEFVCERYEKLDFAIDM